MPMKYLLRFARKVVQNVMSQMTQQLNIVQEQAYNPMQQMVQQVVGGVWVGRGADAFVEDVSNMMMPNVNQIMDTIGITNRNIQNAIDVIDRADDQVNNSVNGLADLFGSIF
jgi:hypothetical protein